MDEKRLREQIPHAVEAHCAHLHADPFLAQKVLRAAAGRFWWEADVEALGAEELREFLGLG